MMRNGHILVIGAVLGCLGNASAQDPQFSQFYASAQYLNPALTGNTPQDRIALNYRLQWPGVQPGFETFSFAYDHRFPDAHSGIGGYLLRDQAGQLGLNYTTAAMSYSYEARLNYKHALRFGLRAGYTMRGLSQSGFLFADQLIRDNAANTIEVGLIERIGYLDMAGGMLYYTEAFWGGVSINHLNTPNQSLIMDGTAPLAMRVTTHMGYRFALDGRILRRSDTRMTIATHYKAQAQWDQLDMGAYVDVNHLNIGLWYRGIPIFKAYQPGYSNSEAVILMAGFQTDKQLRFTYSYDITVSKLSMKSGGAHEISLIYEWPKTGKNRKWRTVPCPKF